MSDPTLTFKNRAEWESWLELNGGTTTGAWLRLAKKSAGQQTVTYAEAIESALCYGWIDGQNKQKASNIGSSVLRPGNPKASGPKSTKQKRKLSFPQEE